MAEYKTADELDTLKKDMARLREDMEALTLALRSDAETATEDQRAAVRRFGETAKARARLYGERAAGYGRDGWGQIEHQIEERPLTSMLMAFGLGMVLGKLLDR